MKTWEYETDLRLLLRELVSYHVAVEEEQLTPLEMRDLDHENGVAVIIYALGYVRREATIDPRVIISMALPSYLRENLVNGE